MTTEKPRLAVSVFSDYICPFCYIGSRRLLRLADEFDLKVNWCGTEIHPNTPSDGMSLSKLGYSPEAWAQLSAELQILAHEEGLQFTDRDYTANSHQALLLAEAAKRVGRDIFYTLHEALFHAYFVRGQNIGDREVLKDIALEAGLPADLAQAAWSEPEFEQRLQQNLLQAARLHIRATPTYLFGQQILVGAVPFNQLTQAANRLIQERQAL